MNGRIICMLVFLLFEICVQVNAQFITPHEINGARDNGGESWVKKARILKDSLSLNEYGDLVMVASGRFPCQNQSQLFEKFTAWLEHSLEADGLNAVYDRNAFTVTIRPDIPDLAVSSVSKSVYRIGVRPLVEVRFKDGKARLSFTLHNYYVTEYYKDETIGNVGTQLLFTESKRVAPISVSWALRECYPFEEDKRTSLVIKRIHPRKIMAKAFVNLMASYGLMLEKFNNVLSADDEKNDVEW